MKAAYKKKGLSIEEKLHRVEQWFVQNPSPFTVKELTALIPRDTGVIYQSINECLEVLASENRIQMDKIGVHVLYWRFPPTPTQQLGPDISSHGNAASFPGRTTKRVDSSRYDALSVDELAGELEQLCEQEGELEAGLRKRHAECGTVADEQEAQIALYTLSQEKNGFQTRLQQLAYCDASILTKLKDGIMLALEAANRWTENLFLLEEYVTAKLGMSTRELRLSLHLPQTIDFIVAAELCCHTSLMTEDNAISMSVTTSMGNGTRTAAKGRAILHSLAPCNLSAKYDPECSTLPCTKLPPEPFQRSSCSTPQAAHFSDPQLVGSVDPQSTSETTSTPDVVPCEKAISCDLVDGTETSNGAGEASISIGSLANLSEPKKNIQDGNAGKQKVSSVGKSKRRAVAKKYRPRFVKRRAK